MPYTQDSIRGNGADSAPSQQPKCSVQMGVEPMDIETTSPNVRGHIDEFSFAQAGQSSTCTDGVLHCPTDKDNPGSRVSAHLEQNIIDQVKYGHRQNLLRLYRGRIADIEAPVKVIEAAYLLLLADKSPSRFDASRIQVPQGFSCDEGSNKEFDCILSRPDASADVQAFLKQLPPLPAGMRTPPASILGPQGEANCSSPLFSNPPSPPRSSSTHTNGPRSFAEQLQKSQRAIGSPQSRPVTKQRRPRRRFRRKLGRLFLRQAEFMKRLDSLKMGAPVEQREHHRKTEIEHRFQKLNDVYMEAAPRMDVIGRKLDKATSLKHGLNQEDIECLEYDYSMPFGNHLNRKTVVNLHGVEKTNELEKLIPQNTYESLDKILDLIWSPQRVEIPPVAPEDKLPSSIPRLELPPLPDTAYFDPEWVANEAIPAKRRHQAPRTERGYTADELYTARREGKTLAEVRSMRSLQPRRRPTSRQRRSATAEGNRSPNTSNIRHESSVVRTDGNGRPEIRSDAGRLQPLDNDRERTAALNADNTQVGRNDRDGETSSPTRNDLAAGVLTRDGQECRNVEGSEKTHLEGPTRDVSMHETMEAVGTAPEAKTKPAQCKNNANTRENKYEAMEPQAIDSEIANTARGLSSPISSYRRETATSLDVLVLVATQQKILDDRARLSQSESPDVIMENAPEAVGSEGNNTVDGKGSGSEPVHARRTSERTRRMRTRSVGKAESRSFRNENDRSDCVSSRALGVRDEDSLNVILHTGESGETPSSTGAGEQRCESNSKKEGPLGADEDYVSLEEHTSSEAGAPISYTSRRGTKRPSFDNETDGAQAQRRNAAKPKPKKAGTSRSSTAGMRRRSAVKNKPRAEDVANVPSQDGAGDTSEGGGRQKARRMGKRSRSSARHCERQRNGSGSGGRIEVEGRRRKRPRRRE